MQRFHTSILSDAQEAAATALGLSNSLASTTTSESARVQTAREVVLEALHRATSRPVGTLQDRLALRHQGDKAQNVSAVMFAVPAA